MENLLRFIHTIQPIGPSLDRAIRERLTQAEFKKGDILASPGRRADEIWFIAKGLAKEFHIEACGKVVVTTFWKENELMLISDSFFLKLPSDRYIQLIEDCSLFNLESKKAHELLHLYPELQSIIYKIQSITQKKIEDRGALMMLRGTERYENFCENFPHTRISIVDAASYLGLTRVGLSKIRGKK
ncbi:MAG: Crp/Fnr family transcriptional regulator [Daejeonella sp.]